MVSQSPLTRQSLAFRPALLVGLTTTLLGILSLVFWLVLSSQTLPIDQSLLLLLRNPADISDPLGPLWLEELMRDVTGLGGVGILSLLTLLSCICLLLKGNKALAWRIVICIASGMLCSSLLKYGIDRPRPDLVPHGSYVYTSSFPSGHSMMAAVVYFTLASAVSACRPQCSIRVFCYGIALLLVLLIGFSRVYLGVHWPSDVLAGWLAGSLWVLLFRLSRI